MLNHLTINGKRITQSLLDLFYPPHCYHCETPLNNTRRKTLCHSCLQLLKKTRITAPFCQICGLRLTGQEGQKQAECLNCRMLRPPFSTARALFPYSGPAETLVRSYKYKGNYFLGPRIIHLAAKLDWLPTCFNVLDAIVPVPLHPRRLAHRGYNQATLMAKVLSKEYAAYLEPQALVRHRQTRQQARLTRPQRRDNVRGAFVAGNKDVSGLNILLVDDVMTTGATAGECAQTLRKAGADSVHVFTLVRAYQ